MFDDIRRGFVGGKLDVIDILIAESILTRDLPHKFADLVKEFKFRRELNGTHWEKIKKTALAIIAKSGFHVALRFGCGPLRGLEIPHRIKRIVKRLEQFGEARQFERLADAIGHGDKHYFAAIIFLRVALGG